MTDPVFDVSVPRRRDVMIWSVLLALWTFCLAHVPAITLPQQFLNWTVLALPAYLLASKEREAVVVVLGWAAIFVFCLNWTDIAPDVGLPQIPYRYVRAVINSVVEPAPFVIMLIALERSRRASVRARAV